MSQSALSARPSYGPPPPSVAPPARNSVPPPSLTATPTARKVEAALVPASRSEAPKPSSARAPVPTIPDGMHEIGGEEERTNPWDIPTDVNLPVKG